MMRRNLTYLTCSLPVPELKKPVQGPFDASYTLLLTLESILSIESLNRDFGPVLTLIEIQ